MPDAVDDPTPEEDRLTRFGETGVARGLEHLEPFRGRMVSKLEEAAGVLGEEDPVDQKMLVDLDREYHEQPPVEAAGVDLGAIRAVDPQFDDFAFRSIARETFNKVREARSTERTDEADALMSPAMEAEIGQEVSGDVAAHRHHLLPGLEVDQATIVAAAVAGGREVVDVRLDVAGEELERDDATGAVVAGDATVRRWSERWRFERDPSMDSSQTDRDHTLKFGDEGWLVAHRGWVVTQIERLPAAPAAPAPVGTPAPA
ncbi:MAG: TIM44-like domain-containing protein [Candidatus Dormibacteria bacterium]